MFGGLRVLACGLCSYWVLNLLRVLWRSEDARRHLGVGILNRFQVKASLGRGVQGGPTTICEWDIPMAASARIRFLLVFGTSF